MNSRIAGLLVLVMLGSVVAAGPATAATGAPGLRNVDSGVAEVVRDIAAGRSVDSEPGALLITPGERVLVDVYVTDVDRSLAPLRAAGMEVQAVSRRAPFELVEGLLPVEAVREAAALPTTISVIGAAPGVTDTGTVNSEGDASHRGPQARSLGGVSGGGIEVGVISDSINQKGGGINDSQASGNLPPDPRVEVFSDDLGASDEGRAMAEIIYDTAPGLISFRFGSGTAAGPAGKVASIDNLVAGGAKVIADDISSLGEPFFQDGIISQAVDRARAADVAYFASAGNRARQSYESTYRNTGVEHDFDPTAAADPVQTIRSVAPGDSLAVFFQWDEPWGRATTDLDISLVRVDDPGAVLATSVTDNPATGIPSELVFFENTTAAPVPVALRIRRFAGARNPFMKYIARSQGGGFAIAEYNTASDTINPDAASARGAIATAAVAWDDVGLDTPENFSSRGPKVRLFDAAGNRLPAPEVRAKPELAAADRVQTSVPGFQPFFGTSAAAPSAAAIAVLMRSVKPSIAADDVDAILTNPANAINCTSALGQPDTDCGAGFVLADRAITQALDNTPPVIGVGFTPAGPTGDNGFFTAPAAVSFTATDAQSPVSRPCGPARPIPETAGTVFSCTAKSAGGFTTQSVLLRRDTVAPTVALSGIRARAYTGASLPTRRRVKCSGADATSGIATCEVSAYGTRTGRHAVTGIATDRAGNVARTVVRYRVKAPVARKLRLRRSGRGFVISYRLGSKAKMRFTVERRAGRRFKKLKGAFGDAGKKGRNSFRFSGRLGGGRLAPGAYRLVGVPVDRYGNRGKALKVPFRI